MKKNPTFFSARAIFVLTGLVAAINSYGQATAFNDDFTTSTGSSFTTTGAIGGSAKWNLTRSGADFGARIHGGNLTLTNNANSGLLNLINGWVFASTNTANFTAPYNSTLNSNPGIMTWTFNMRQSRPDPSGFETGSFGVAYVLAGSNDMGQFSGTGYAVILGSPGITDPIELVRIDDGLEDSTPLITSNTSGLADFDSQYISIKVTYTPSTETWQLFVRNDGYSGFADPAAGTLVSQGSVVNSAYTGTSLPLMGGYWNAGGGLIGSQVALFDNAKIAVALPITSSISPSSKIAGTGAFTLTVNGANFVSGSSTVRWNGSNRTTTYISPTQLTASINAADIASPGAADVTVINGTTVSNSQTFTIAEIPFSVSVSGGGSFCQNATVTLTALPSDEDTPYTYSWSGGLGNESTASPATNIAGTYNYTITVTDSNGFSATDSATVVIIPESVGGTLSANQSICYGTPPADITLSGNTGSILYWQSATDNSFTSPENIANTTNTLSGASVGNLYATTYFRAIIKNANCNEVFSSVITVAIPTTTWNGTSWSNSAPTSSITAIMSGNYTSTGDVNACALVVKNNAVVIASSGNNFYITGLVSVETGSNLTFQNNSNLVQSGTVNNNTGNITVTRNAFMRRLDYVYWSSPVADQQLQAFSPNTLSNRFFIVDEPTNTYVAIDPTANFELAKGYMIRSPNNFPSNGAITQFTGIFKGKPNSGDITMPITKSDADKGFNMIGNPYPSTIDADFFLLANPHVITLYFWSHINQNQIGGINYATYNYTGVAHAGGAPSNTNPVSATPNGYIQTGQGFVVTASSSGNVIFNNSMRAGNNSDQFFRAANTEKNRIWINLSTGHIPLNQTLIGYITGATNGLDDKFDGKLIETNGSRFYSLIDNGQYTIQGRALPFADTDVVPMGFKAATDGSYTIAFDHADGLFSDSQEIFIKDNLNGIIHNIKNSPYNFTSIAGTFHNRFEVVYKNAMLGIENPKFDTNSVILYNQNGMLNIDTGNITMQSVKISDISGRIIFENDKLNATKATIALHNVAQQVLVVQITSDDNRTISKKVVY